MVFKVLSLVLVTLVVVTGCATTPATSSPTATGQSKTTAATPKPVVEPTKPAPQQASPTSKPAASAPSGTLTSAVSSFGEDTLDPMLSGATNHAALIYPMFEMLARDDGRGNLVLQLAESMSISPDGKVWNIKIRKGIKFHNGDELTSADVKFSLERIISQKARAAVTPILRPLVDRIDAPDPYTVAITTKDVNAILLDLLSGGAVIMPKKYIEEKGEAYFAENPVGTGPWKFVKHDAGSSLELEAVKDHWRITPAFQKLVIKLVPEESTRMAMLKRGEVDVIDISLDRADEVKAAGLETQAAPYESQPVMYLGGTWMDTGQPTQDLKVRQALALAINREELAKTFFKGYAQPAIRVKMGANSFAWDPSWKPDPYDPQKAKALLAEAGYPNKFKEPVITMWAHQSPAWMSNFVQIVSGYWEGIGVKTKITPLDFAAVRAMYIAKPVDPKIVGTAYPFGEGAARNPLMSVFNAYGSTGVNSNLNDKAWDDLYARSLKEFDENKRIELTRQLMTQGYNHYSIIMTVNVKSLYAVSNRIGEWRTVGGPGTAYEGMQHK